MIGYGRDEARFAPRSTDNTEFDLHTEAAIMGKNTKVHRRLSVLALLLAALMLCAGMPGWAESDADFSFDLSGGDAGVQAQVSSGVDANPFAPAEDADAAEEDAAEEDAEAALAFPDQDAGEPEAEAEAEAEDGADAFTATADLQQDEAAGTGIFADVTAPTYPAEITITAVGDCTLGGASRNKTDRKFEAMVKKKGYDYFFKNVREIFEKDDLTIVNLEGPLTTSNDRKKKQYYAFKGDPKNVQILSGSSVEIANVANNHSMDYGKKGYQQTQKVLQDAGIGVSGNALVYSTTIKGVRVTSLGFTKWDHSVADIRKAVENARRDCDLLIVSIHWGKEKKFRPDSQQKDMGRAAIAAGADLVIGTHTHVYGALEKYNGKYIVYSLGNFCFGGNPYGRDKRCLIFQQTFSYSPTTGVADAGINIIPATYSSSAKKNDYQPAIMDKKAGQKLLKAVAKISKGVNKANTLWMPDNYLVWSGIMTQEQLDAANAQVRGEAPAPAAEPAATQEVTEAETDGAGADEAAEAEEDDALAGFDEAQYSTELGEAFDNALADSLEDDVADEDDFDASADAFDFEEDLEEDPEEDV